MDSAAREAYLRILVDTGDANDLAAILNLSDASLQARVLPALAADASVRDVRPAGDLTAALRPLIAGRNSELRAEALKLAGVWKLEVFRTDAENIARDDTASETVRRAAIEALAGLGGERSNAILTVLAAPEEAVSVRSAAIAALCGFDLESAAEFASRSLARLNNGAAFDEIFSS